MSVGSKRAKEQAKRRLPDNYMQSAEEEQAYLYCVKNKIIINANRILGCRYKFARQS